MTTKPVLTKKAFLTFIEEDLCFQILSFEPLKQEVSNRDYFKVVTKSIPPSQKDFFIQSPPPHNNQYRFVVSVNHREIEPEDDFITIQYILKKHSINVPEIYRIDYNEGLIWQSDLEQTDLADIVLNKENKQHNGNSESDLDQKDDNINGLYKQTIDALVKFKEIAPAPPAGNRFFDFEKLRWELQYLFDAVKSHLPDPSVVPQNGVLKEWDDLCRELDKHSRERFVHRDLHSRNIKVRNNQIYLIDFQDARTGCRYYDLASLLYDPYVSLTENFREEMFQYYHEKSNEKPDLKLYHNQAFQRLLKALGTYIKQSLGAGKPAYFSSIKPALASLQYLFQQHEEMPKTEKWIGQLSETLDKFDPLIPKK